MKTIETVYLGELRTEATHLQSSVKFVTDAPTDNNGKGESFSPTDMVAAALGSCMLTIMGMSARTHGFSIDGTQLSVTKIMGSAPRRIAEIIVEVDFPQDYDAKTKRILELSGKECPVAQSLHPDTKQTLIFRYGK